MKSKLTSIEKFLLHNLETMKYYNYNTNIEAPITSGKNMPGIGTNIILSNWALQEHEVKC